MSLRETLERRLFARRERALTYCYKRCPCGALYAIDNAKRAWDCSDIILGLAAAAGEPGSVTHDDTMPFIFWKVKEAPRDWALEHRRVPVGSNPSRTTREPQPPQRRRR